MERGSRGNKAGAAVAVVQQWHSKTLCSKMSRHQNISTVGATWRAKTAAQSDFSAARVMPRSKAGGNKDVAAAEAFAKTIFLVNISSEKH